MHKSLSLDIVSYANESTPTIAEAAGRAPAAPSSASRNREALLSARSRRTGGCLYGYHPEKAAQWEHGLRAMVATLLVSDTSFGTEADRNRIHTGATQMKTTLRAGELIDEQCPVCNSILCSGIGEMRNEGDAIETISEASGLSVADIQRHFARCADAITTDPALTESDDQLILLYKRCIDLFRSSTFAGHWAASASALSAGLRTLTEAQRRKEVRQKQGGALGACSASDPATWTPEISAFINEYLLSVVESARERGVTTETLTPLPCNRKESIEGETA